MKVSEYPRGLPEAGQIRADSAGFGQRQLRSQVIKLLSRLESGELQVNEPAEGGGTYGKPAADGLRAEINVHAPSAWTDVALRGSIGAAEGYIRGEWSTPELVNVTRLFARNIDVLDQMEQGLARLLMPALRAAHSLNRNTTSGSKKNISAHYDLSNDFFSTFLDPLMMYSSAVFEHPEQGLDEAAVNKLDRLVKKLDLGPDNHLLEIGTGWGGLATYAAKETGCRVTTTTISKEQFDHAVALVKAQGLEGQVEVLMQDYRLLTGQYDRLMSVEMIEAVGHEFVDEYFAKCQSLLADDGVMVLQAITMAEHRWEQAKSNVDFIQKYIFPGGSLPSLGSISSAVANRTSLQPVHIENLAWHYARTLKIWRERFLERRDEVIAMGFDESFVRMWEYYLAYCEAGFAEGTTGLLQLTYAGPRAALDASRIDLWQ